jgi:hypothetical protein
VQVLRSLFDTLDIHQQGSLNDLQFLALLKYAGRVISPIFAAS